MNLLDENFPDDQLPILRQWGIPFRQLGRGVAALGVQDDDVVSLLHRRRRVTFFTQDWDFFRAALCHPAYCLVWLDVRADDTAICVRRFLQHPRFASVAQRLGIVARAHHDGVHFSERNRAGLQRVSWPER